MFFQKGVQLCAIVVEIDADDFEPVLLVLFVELHQLGQILLDGRGPARPEDDQDRLASILRRVDRVVCEGPSR